MREKEKETYITCSSPIMTALLFLSSLFSPFLSFHLGSCTNSLSFHVSIIPNWSLRKIERDSVRSHPFYRVYAPLSFPIFRRFGYFLSNIKFRSIYLKKKKGEKFRELIFELKMIFETWNIIGGWNFEGGIYWNF